MESTTPYRRQRGWIHTEDWDYLIVLDACRYDYFTDVVKEYLEGESLQLMSSGSMTTEWLNKTWTKEHDLTYISGNPYINSLGKEMDGFRATDHFSNIVDVWLERWSDRHHTVTPHSINLSTLEKMDDKMVIHYVQPHLPYVPNKSGSSFTWDNRENVSKESIGDKRFRNLRDRLGGLYDTHKFFWILRNQLNLGPKAAYEKLWRDLGPEKLRELYLRNLRVVLNDVSHLVNELDGEIVITADHGESLGDLGIWGHPKGIHTTALTRVPWFRVTGSKTDKGVHTGNLREIVKDVKYSYYKP